MADYQVGVPGAATGAIPAHLHNRILVGDVRARLAELPDESVHCVVTSPPYWGLRDYGVPGQLGLEATSDEYVATMVEVFRDVRRVLRRDGTLWLNLGDTYSGSCGGYGLGDRGQIGEQGERWTRPGYRDGNHRPPSAATLPGLKRKDLVGVPWRVALALQADGWYLRSDIIWHKTNPMPESVRDRPTRAHDYLFLLAKSRRYHYDVDAIMQPTTGTAHPRGGTGVGQKAKTPTGWDTGPGAHNGLAGRYPRKRPRPRQNASFHSSVKELVDRRNSRTVWSIPTQAFPQAHFATFPEALVEPCIRAGCPVDGIVLDPFLGSGTTALVALKLGRHYVGVELNPGYVAMAERRLRAEVPLLMEAGG